MQSGERETATRAESFATLVRELVTPQQYDTWFRAVVVHEDDDGTLRLLAPNPFVRDWLTTYYSDVVASAVRGCFGDQRKVVVQVNPVAPPVARVEARPERLAAGEEVAALIAPAADRDAPASDAKTSGDDAASDSYLHSDYTFENFVVGSSNRFAHAAALAVAEAPGRHYNPFFMHGSVGLGKTHLLQAVCHAILQREPRTNLLYLSCESFTNHFIESIERGALGAFRQKYRNVDVLLVDDIHLLENKERTQEEFFHTFNTLYNLGRQIVLTSDAPPKDIPTLQERLVSRFKMGLVVEIAPPDFETRVSIVRRKARLKNLDLPDDVAHYLAEHVATNIRELEGAVTRLVGYASLVGRPLDLALAQDTMHDTLSRRSAAVGMGHVIQVVTKYYNVRPADLVSKRRTQSIALPRQMCMYLARKLTNLSLNEIGAYFGGRDHTTVLYAEEKIQKSVDTDPRAADLVRHLRLEIETQ